MGVRGVADGVKGDGLEPVFDGLVGASVGGEDDRREATLVDDAAVAFLEERQEGMEGVGGVGRAEGGAGVGDGDLVAEGRRAGARGERERVDGGSERPADRGRLRAQGIGAVSAEEEPGVLSRTPESLELPAVCFEAGAEKGAEPVCVGGVVPGSEEGVEDAEEDGGALVRA